MGRKSRNAGKKKTKVQPEGVATELTDIDKTIMRHGKFKRGNMISINVNKMSEEKKEIYRLDLILRTNTEPIDKNGKRMRHLTSFTYNFK